MLEGKGELNPSSLFRERAATEVVSFNAAVSACVS